MRLTIKRNGVIISQKEIPEEKGLGDLVAEVAQPIAGMIDKVAGTNLKNCGGCKQRQEALNKIKI